MPTKLNKIEQLIEELCHEGVEWKTLDSVCSQISAGGDLPLRYLKGQQIPTEEFLYPIFSNGSDEKALYGYTDSYKIDCESVTISARGTIGYHAVRKAKFTPIVRLIALIVNTEIITSKFLNYVLDITEIGHSGGSIPQLTVPNVKKIKIPIPPLPIQKEIVKILDNFTELEAELEARKKQYEYYRDELLTFGDEVESKELGEICKVTSNIKWSDKKSEEFKYIDLSSVNRSNNTIMNTQLINFETAPSRAQKIVITDDVIFGTTRPTLKRYCFITSEYNNEICSTGFCVLRANKDIVLPKWIYYHISTIKYNNYINEVQRGASYPAVTDANVKRYRIPIPPLAEQKRIVSILDKFNALVNDISIGLEGVKYIV